MRATQLRIVIVVVVMRVRPDTGRRDRNDTPDLHEKLRRLRFVENGVVLVIVVDDEESNHQKT